MLIAIDGYNVLKQALKKEFVSENERDQFINRLARYARRKKHELIVVFDGGVIGSPLKQKHRGITIVYAGDMMSADDYLCDYLEDVRGRDPLLISSDRVVRSAAARQGLDSLPSDDFYRLLEYELGILPIGYTGVGSVEKTTLDGDHELDQLMHEMSQDLVTKECDMPREHVQLVRSRVSKRLAKKLKSL